MVVLLDLCSNLIGVLTNLGRSLIGLEHRELLHQVVLTWPFFEPFLGVEDLEVTGQLVDWVLSV